MLFIDIQFERMKNFSLLHSEQKYLYPSINGDFVF